jgi:formylglycine-generating enzyme required for sulfatase activity
VTLGAYFIDATEVTVDAYLACVERGPCRAPGPRCPGPGADRPTHPVACVDWNQAQSYCSWVGKRLPTEAEWEKAARGGDQRPYPWGHAPPTCVRVAFNDRGEDPGAVRGCGRGASWPVGSFAAGASPYGALDMAGNVWEWVADHWSPDYYAESPRTDPSGPESGDMRVRRGGSWRSLGVFLPSAVRGRMDPAERNEIVGFRCAKSP